MCLHTLSMPMQMLTCKSAGGTTLVWYSLLASEQISASAGFPSFSTVCVSAGRFVKSTQAMHADLKQANFRSVVISSMEGVPWGSWVPCCAAYTALPGAVLIAVGASSAAANPCTHCLAVCIATAPCMEGEAWVAELGCQTYRLK